MKTLEEILAALDGICTAESMEHGAPQIRVEFTTEDVTPRVFEHGEVEIQTPRVRLGVLMLKSYSTIREDVPDSDPRIGLELAIAAARALLQMAAEH